MIEFGYILIIVIELIIASIIIFALKTLEKRIKNCLLCVNEQARETLCTIKNVRLNLRNFNKYVCNIKKIDIKKIKQAILLVLDIVNFVLLIKSMDFKNLKKAKNLKKLIPYSLIKKLIFNFKTSVK